MSQLPISEVDPKTLAKLGIKLSPSLEQASKRHTALGRVLKAIEELDEDDVLWVLHEAKIAYLHQGEAIQEDPGGDGYTPPLAWTVEIVAKAFGIKLQDMMGRRRPPEFVVPRQVAMYLLWSTQKYTLYEIGDALGGRTPATVSWGFNAIANALQRDKGLKRKVDSIKETLL